MAKLSAGVLLFRRANHGIEVFLVHPGGPFWAKKDNGAWSLPKGEYVEGDEPLAAARREFEEETGIGVDGDFVSLGQVRQRGGKVVTAWALERDLDPGALKSNTFPLEWPPGSGRVQEFPEVDRGAWFSLPEARVKLLKGQVPFIDRLERVAGDTVPAG